MTYHFIVLLNVVTMLVTLPMNVATYGEKSQLGMGIVESPRRSSAVTLLAVRLGVRFMLKALWLMALTATLGASPWETLLSSLRIEVIVAVMMVL